MMTTPRYIAVIDIGKTNAKLALVDLQSLSEIAVVTRPNSVLFGPPWPHFDLEGHWEFLLDALTTFNKRNKIDAISITTHGASAVLLDKDGNLAAPMLDYEHTGPESIADDYDALRPRFAESGSPRLAVGLNLGAQLHWMFETDENLKDRTASIVTYPQYWGFRLTGAIACDVSSLGCHTDLWDPHQRTFSSLVDTLNIRDKMAPARPAADILGTVSAHIADKTGLSPSTPVHVGIHDSNASLVPHLLGSTPPFSVISTGTWVIAMSVGGKQITLDPTKDTLINVNAFGEPVPSARFMGGREFELAMQDKPVEPTADDIAQVLEQNIALMPALQRDTGPFKGQQARWFPEEPAVGTGIRSAAVAFYLAMVSSHCLSMIGHDGDIIVEGPFTRNQAYLDMLATVTGCTVIAAGSATGTSQGAALLAAKDKSVPKDLPQTKAKDHLRAYAEQWQSALNIHCA